MICHCLFENVVVPLSQGIIMNHRCLQSADVQGTPNVLRNPTAKDWLTQTIEGPPSIWWYILWFPLQFPSNYSLETSHSEHFLGFDFKFWCVESVKFRMLLVNIPLKPMSNMVEPCRKLWRLPPLPSVPTKGWEIVFGVLTGIGESSFWGCQGVQYTEKTTFSDAHNVKTI